MRGRMPLRRDKDGARNNLIKVTEVNIFDENGTIGSKCKEQAYRPLCGVCQRALSPMEIQEKLLSSGENSLTVCTCTQGSYIVELDLSTPNCLRLVHTYRLHAKREMNMMGAAPSPVNAKDGFEDYAATA